MGEDRAEGDRPALMDELLRDVLSRIESTPDPRLRRVLLSAVTHLHAFARDVGLAEDELMAGAAS